MYVWYQGGSRGTTPLIINLDTRSSQVLNITFWPSYLRERSAVPFDYKYLWATEPVLRVDRRTEYFVLAGIGPLNSSVRSLVTMLTG